MIIRSPALVDVPVWCRCMEEGIRPSVVVCTGGRVDLLELTLRSIQATDSEDHPVELVVVDQSPSHQAAEVADLTNKAGGRYLRSKSIGNGAARNEGWNAANGNILLYTDDDCEVPPDWIRSMIDEFREPGVGMVFCQVTAGPHDPSAGYIPTYTRSDSVTLTTLRHKTRARGIGAGLAVKRELLERLEGFDEMLGPGAPYYACVDGDLTVRALIDGWFVRETDRTAVVHHGFRTWGQGRLHVGRASFGIGAAYSKPLKACKLGILPVLATEFWLTLRRPLIDLVHGRRPHGLAQPWHMLRGLSRGLLTPINRRTLRFQPKQ